MNCVQGTIADLHTEGSLTLVTLKTDREVSLKVILIDTRETAEYLTLGAGVKALFKETEVVIGTGAIPALSVANKLSGKITGMVRGVLLSRLTVETTAGEIVSVIGSEAAQGLDLKISMPVYVLIDMNHIILSH